MKKLIVILCIGLSLSVSANQYKDEFVEVSIQPDIQNNSFQLKCTPKVVVSELPKNWVATCNNIGKKLLSLAVENGMKVEIVDKPFGMAGDFPTAASNKLPENIKPKAIISPKFRENIL